jgi:glycosyltransferase involved in cell wall biosynthesis
VYESLRRQTFRDFEWLVVDDGSADDTPRLVERWAEEAWFPVRYVRQENQGKHVAVNRGVLEANGELFLLLDSDDECVPEALERFHKHWRSIPEAERPRFSAVTALCVDQQGRLVGEEFPKPVVDSDSLEMRYRYRTRGEKWGFQRTDVLRRFPYPVLEGERFVPEDVVWSAIAREYRTRYVNERLRIYHTHGTGSSDQLTSDARVSRFAGGLAHWHAGILTSDIVWLRHSPGAFARSAIHFSRFSFHRGVSLREQWRRIGHPAGRLLWLAALPAGYLAYRRDRARESRLGAAGAG